MKRQLFFFALSLILLTGCGKEESYTDNGNPG